MENDHPKLFISYSWTTPDHEQWVLALATDLRESGVDVILDKWDLKEGHDANAFMEKIATDPEIEKVALICDSKYAEKADGRSGGVGTETQIISAEVYLKEVQNKFVAVVCERDQDGKPCLPTYYKSRIYIDLSDQDLYARNFEQLLRWIYDKPEFIKPDLGKMPAFLFESPESSLGTSTTFRRAYEGIQSQRKNRENLISLFSKEMVSHPTTVTDLEDYYGFIEENSVFEAGSGRMLSATCDEILRVWAVPDVISVYESFLLRHVKHGGEVNRLFVAGPELLIKKAQVAFLRVLYRHQVLGFKPRVASITDMRTILKELEVNCAMFGVISDSIGYYIQFPKNQYPIMIRTTDVDFVNRAALIHRKIYKASSDFEKWGVNLPISLSAQQRKEVEVECELIHKMAGY